MKYLVNLIHGGIIGYTAGLAYGGLNVTSIAVILAIIIGPVLGEHLAQLESTNK